jgi:hypothetical protein
MSKKWMIPVAIDFDIWDEVVLGLEINIYKIQNRATRVAVMASALAHLENKP